MKLALISSAQPVEDEEVLSIVRQVVKLLYENGAELVTGGCSGIPEHAIREMVRLGGVTTVFSPDKNADRHVLRSDNIPLGVATNYIYKEGFSQRSIDMLKYVDGVIVVNGRIGTLSEFTMAIEEGIPALVIENTGGIADHLDYILRVIKKEFPKNFILFSEEVADGVNKLVNYLNDKKTP